jgi:hypothetical protein
LEVRGIALRVELENLCCKLTHECLDFGGRDQPDSVAELVQINRQRGTLRMEPAINLLEASETLKR